MSGTTPYNRCFASLSLTGRHGLAGRLALAALALLAAACGKIETWEGDPVPVAFSTYARQSTKADASYVAPGANFAAGAQIGVFGFYHDGNGATDGSWAADQAAGNNIPDYMYNQLVTKQDDGSWTYSPIKYWPNETGAGATSEHADKLSFWGYYPRIAEANYTADAAMYTGTDAVLRFWKAGSTTEPYANDVSGLPRVTFTQSADPDKMVDLMFAAPQQDLTKPSLDGKVQFVFRHALALVEFQLAEGTGAKLNTLDLTNIKKSGTVEDPGTVPFVWSGVDDSSEYTTHIEDLDVHEATLLRLLAVPQTLNDNATFTLNYDITFESSDPTHPDPIVYKGDSFSVKLFDNTNADPSKRYGVTKWEAGKHYIYKISAGLDRIEFEEIVDSPDDWSIGNNNISVPE